jgi:glycosyltransferase involved in cell wall biosynthesis
MRIIYFHQHFSTPKGATGIRSYEMARSLISHGHHVIMVCGSYGGGATGLSIPFTAGQRRGNVDGIDVIEFDLTYANSDGFIRRTLIFIKFAIFGIRLTITERYDILFATTTPLTAGIPGIFARWLRMKPFVFEVRDLWPELPKAMGVIKNPILLYATSCLEWLCYHSAHRLIGLSPGIVEGVVSRGIAPERILEVSNGCDLEIFSNKVKPWRPDGISEEDLLAVFAGTHGVANGLDALLDVALDLKLRGQKKIKLLLIGQGKIKPMLLERVKREELSNVLLLDPVEKEQLASLLAASDIGIQVLANIPAFYYGTSPNKFFDYIAAGLPVINNYPGWLSELVKENNCGLIVPPDDPKAFADALEWAVNNKSCLQQMGLRSRTLAETQFDRVKLADRWVGWVTGLRAGV